MKQWRRWTRTVLAALALALLAPALPGEAQADLCGDCGPPTRADLEKDPSFKLEERLGGILDVVYLHAGECTLSLTGAPRIQKIRSWLVVRGKGAVWSCPSGSASDTMTASVTATDRKAWSLTESASAKLTVMGIGFAGELEKTVSREAGIEEITTISKIMKAAWCRVIQWEGWFEVSEFTAEVDFVVKRRFGWWTKHLLTGDTVHRSGSVWLTCGTDTATLMAHAPIAGYFLLKQTPCPDPACKGIAAQTLGFFPPLPPFLAPPVTPSEDGETAEGVLLDEPFGPAESPEQGEGDPESAEGEQGEGDPEPAAVEPPADEEDEEEEEKDPIPSSDELGDPPAGVPPFPPGFGPADEETNS